MFWRKKSIVCNASVLFRGSLPPRAADFEYLSDRGVTIQEEEANPGVHWLLSLDHPRYGRAMLGCLRNIPGPPREIIASAVELVQSEKDLAATGRATVTLQMQGAAGDILRDRKNMLWYLRQVMGDDGVVAIDHTSTRLWSRGALDDELCHDADLDIASLFSVHAVTQDDGQPVSWLHTHGLAELGLFDFDILNPCEDLLAVGGQDILRALAFAIFEGGRELMGGTFPLECDGRAVHFVDVRQFTRRAAPRYLSLRSDPGADHAEDRAVVCDPPRSRWLRWLGRPAPSRWLSAPLGERLLLNFSASASQLMAERGRQTYDLFRRLCDEFAEFDFPNIVKLHYGQDADGTGGEHMWFEVHELHDDRIDATLRSTPFNIPDMREGDRGMHPLERITDWAILTPAGMISPRATVVARFLRENRDELLAAMREGAEGA